MNFLKSANGKKIASIAAAVVSVGILIVVIARHTVLADPSVDELSRKRTAIDSESGKVFESLYVKDGSTWPWKNPDTGKNSLYPPEYCYWTKDGKAKLVPTPVLLNELVGKQGKTMCPDCGRAVVFHNPMPPNELMIEAAKRAGTFVEEK